MKYSKEVDQIKQEQQAQRDNESMQGSFKQSLDSEKERN